MSLKDQLLKAGLVSEKQAKQAGHKHRVERKQTGREVQERETRAAREEAHRQGQAARENDRAREAQARGAREEKERTLSGRQKRETLLARVYGEGVLAHWQGRRDYYFTDGKRVELLRVGEETARRLENGEAAIARLPDTQNAYTVLAAGAAAQLQEADPAAVVVFHR